MTPPHWPRLRQLSVCVFQRRQHVGNENRGQFLIRATNWLNKSNRCSPKNTPRQEKLHGWKYENAARMGRYFKKDTQGI